MPGLFIRVKDGRHSTFWPELPAWTCTTAVEVSLPLAYNFHIDPLSTEDTEETMATLGNALEFDESKLNAFMQKAVMDMGAAMHATLVVVGDKLGCIKRCQAPAG